MLVDFRPHKLQKFIPGSGGDYNDDGNYIEPEYDEDGNLIIPDEEEEDNNEDHVKDSWSDYIPCRYETNTKALAITLDTGDAYIYNYIIYLDYSGVEFKCGDNIKLFDQDDNPRGEFIIKGYHRGQLNCKIWV